MKTLILLVTLSVALFFQPAFAQVVEETAVVDSPPAAEETQPILAAAPVKTLPESQIPLNIENEKKAAASEGMAGKVIYSLAVLVLLGGGILYAVRKYSIPRNSSTQAQIKIVSQHHLGPKKSLALVRVAGESILIGITDQNINLVKSLSLLDEDMPEELPKNFSKTLLKKNQETVEVLDSDEDFTISGIKDVVHRKLQSMRNL